jgi:hypothetical protein
MVLMSNNVKKLPLNKKLILNNKGTLIKRVRRKKIWSLNKNNKPMNCKVSENLWRWQNEIRLLLSSELFTKRNIWFPKEITWKMTNCPQQLLTIMNKWISCNSTGLTPQDAFQLTANLMTMNFWCKRLREQRRKLSPKIYWVEHLTKMETLEKDMQIILTEFTSYFFVEFEMIF